MLEALFENLIAMDIIKLANTLTTSPYIYHWRTSAGGEVDLVLERDGKLFPIEIKCKSQLTKKDARGINAFRETYPKQNVMPGLIIYAGNECFELAEDIIAMPWNAKFNIEEQQVY